MVDASDNVRPIGKLPGRGAKMESEGIIIEWDFPKPANPVIFQPNRQNWAKRLAPMKNTPNRRARVLRDLKHSDHARARVNVIRKSLWARDPTSRWKIESAKADDGTYGVWVTYLGVMSETEFQEAKALREHRSKMGKLYRNRSEEKRKLRRSLLNPTLRPPVVNPDD